MGVDPHVIRYWESEFTQIAPVKGKGRQRLFRREDVLMLRKIRQLLHVQRYTIDGARRLLDDSARPVESKQAVKELEKVIQRLSKYKGGM